MGRMEILKMKKEKNLTGQVLPMYPTCAEIRDKTLLVKTKNTKRPCRDRKI